MYAIQVMSSTVVWSSIDDIGVGATKLNASLQRYSQAYPLHLFCKRNNDNKYNKQIIRDKQNN